MLDFYDISGIAGWPLMVESLRFDCGDVSDGVSTVVFGCVISNSVGTGVFCRALSSTGLGNRAKIDIVEIRKNMRVHISAFAP